ncbi:MAG TPA: glyoxylate/hydroxypyruvate reductase A, partial [Burkholderiaceae bacterium]|nr:glyoxylate/hydroxypyruvate reductase A [Burkholderiaceae bacterium]
MDILLTGQWADDDERDTWLAALQAAVPRARWTVDHGEAEPRWPVSIEVAVVANPPPGRLQGLPRLRLIQSLWAGVDRLLADTTLPAGIPIARMIDPAMNAAMAETALWAVLTLQRGFHHYAAQQRAGEVRVTVLGGGQMGATAARRLAAQGLTV